MIESEFVVVTADVVILCGCTFDWGEFSLFGFGCWFELLRKRDVCFFLIYRAIGN